MEGAFAIRRLGRRQNVIAQMPQNMSACGAVGQQDSRMEPETINDCTGLGRWILEARDEGEANG